MTQNKNGATLIPTGGKDPSGPGYITVPGAVIPFGGNDPSGPGYLVIQAFDPSKISTTPAPGFDYQGRPVYPSVIPLTQPPIFAPPFKI